MFLFYDDQRKQFAFQILVLTHWASSKNSTKLFAVSTAHVFGYRTSESTLRRNRKETSLKKTDDEHPVWDLQFHRFPGRGFPPAPCSAYHFLPASPPKFTWPKTLLSLTSSLLRHSNPGIVTSHHRFSLLGLQ